MLLEETLDQIKPLSASCDAAAQRHLDSLTKPQGSLGRLEELARRVAVIQEAIPPRLGAKLIFVFAADHGITEERVSAYPKEVTAQMTQNFLDGGAAINVLARHYQIKTEIVDVGVDHDFAQCRNLRHCKLRRATANFSRGPALTREQARASVELGIRLVKQSAPEHLFLLGAGEMGIGNTSSAAAIICALVGAAPAKIVGRGTGIDDETLARKITAVENGLRINSPDANDPLDVLAKVGGLEIGAITGVIIAAAAFRLPVVVDGFISGAAALVAQRLSPHIRDILFASHLSAEKGHRLVLDELHLDPLLDLGMRLGEGTGACLAMGLIEASVKVSREMATFASAGVNEKLS
ncbi:MAG TPA: nicotinate-nucleotide--dimethylbenzimidazole phosphoribosyltransferase [Candidatus Binatia bacterium]|nr:nicotinate-nucleotide--dimethylbenzimidazole phosphoribosyltransferase [Candidatus Binatia bacterium]